MGIQDFLVDVALFFFLARSHSRENDCIYLKSPDFIPQICKRDNLPACLSNNLRVIIVSDTHDRHQFIGTLPSSTIFVHCGDILMTNRFYSKRTALKKLSQFNDWLSTVDSQHKLVVAGNHDHIIECIGQASAKQLLSNAIYLENEVLNICGLKIFGSPISLSTRSHNNAFQSTAWETNALSACPDNGTVDILISHGLHPRLQQRAKPKINLFGHSHNSYGIYNEGDVVRGEINSCFSICAPLMDGKYNLSNLPIVIDIPRSGDEFSPESIRVPSIEQLLTPSKSPAVAKVHPI